MLQQMPAVESFNKIGGSELGPNYVMLFCDQIKSMPPYVYKYLLAVFDKKTQEPVYFVASEENSGQKGWGGGSHFLSIYDKPGHLTLAVSDEFAIADVFFPEALRLVYKRFGVSPSDDK